MGKNLMRGGKCACRGVYLEKFIQPAILKILFNEPHHGFYILNKLSETSIFEGNTPDPTGMYRTLKKMEESGLLKSEWDTENSAQPRRIYSITNDGRECLKAWAATLGAYSKRISELSKEISELFKQ